MLDANYTYKLSMQFKATALADSILIKKIHRKRNT
jgi:hypothetical protein